MNERSSDKHPDSSPDGLAVFQTYTNLINSERETLWARHNALVLANSLIIGALAISPAELWENKWAALAMLGAGLVICAAWFLMTVLAWSAMRRHCDLAGSFASSCFAHPSQSLHRNRLQSRAEGDPSPHPSGDRRFHPHVSRVGLYPPRLGMSAARLNADGCPSRMGAG
jgi:hypothetical protein